ncbi:MAG: GvpL/GvpF family gas vesicle protein [Solirubrobacteraceae bacterium]
MTEVHVYGVVAAGAAPAVGSADVRLIAHGDVAALCSDVADGQLHAARELRSHWRVLEEAGTHATVLPVRFGTVMASEQAVVDDFLAPEHDSLAARLRELEGKVQLTVKAFYDEDELMRSVVAGSPAIARLRERVRGLPEAAAYYERIELGQLVAAEVEQARDRDTSLVLDRLQGLAFAATREPPAGLNSAVNAAFLVARDRIDEFSAAVGELGRELEGRMRLRYVGPMPPYSFATGGEKAAWA